MLPFTIKDLKVLNKNSLLASFTVEFQSKYLLTFKNMTLWTGKNGVFCNYPSNSYKDEAGQTKYAWIAFFGDEEFSKEFKAEVAKKAHEEYLKQQPEKPDSRYQPQQNMPF